MDCFEYLRIWFVIVLEIVHRSDTLCRCYGCGFDCCKNLRIGFWILWRSKILWLGELEGGFGYLRRAYCSHVLWCSSVGPLAHCCPNSLPSMLILSHSWSILDISSWDSSVSDEPCVFLWLCCCHYLYCDCVVCHCFVSAQLVCRVSIPFHFYL